MVWQAPFGAIAPSQPGVGGDSSEFIVITPIWNGRHNFPLRPRHAKPRAPIDINSALRIIEVKSIAPQGRWWPASLAWAMRKRKTTRLGDSRKKRYP